MAHHGRTAAAWTASWLGLLGLLVLGWGAIVLDTTLIVIGLVVALLAAPVGGVMGRMAASRR